MPPRAQLEDLMVLRHSPDLFNNVKMGQGQLQPIMKPYIGAAAILVK